MACDWVDGTTCIRWRWGACIAASVSSSKVSKEVPMADKQSSISIDEKFLRNLVARGGKATVLDSGQQITTQAEADEFLKQRVANQKTEKLAGTTSEDESRTSRRVERLAYTDAEREQRKQERERQQQRAARQRGIQAANITMNSINSGTQSLIDRVSAAPVPGGIGLLVAVIVLLLFVVVQVNAEGDTRLKMFWYMLNGRATLVGSKNPTGVTTSATESTTGVQGNIPMPASGVCPAGYRPFTDSIGFTSCVPNSSSLTVPTITPTPAGGPESIAFLPMGGSIYR